MTINETIKAIKEYQELKNKLKCSKPKQSNISMTMRLTSTCVTRVRLHTERLSQIDSQVPSSKNSTLNYTKRLQNKQVP